VLGAAAALIAVANVTWFSTDVVSVLGNDQVISVTGQQVVPALSAAGIVAVAAGVFMALSGRISRYLALVLVIGAGVLALLSSVGAVRSPKQSIISEVAEQTGVDSLTAPVTVHAIAYVGAVMGAALVIVGIAGMFVVRAWGNSTSKYERTEHSVSGTSTIGETQAESNVDASKIAPPTATDTDQLSDSSGNRDRNPVQGAAGVPAVLETGRPHGEVESDERAMWDQLSQGIDPT